MTWGESVRRKELEIYRKTERKRARRRRERQRETETERKIVRESEIRRYLKKKI